MSFHRVSRALTGAFAIGVVAVPVLVVASSPASLTAQLQARTTVTSTARVTYPVVARKPVDLRTSGKHPGTAIKAPCGSVVRAATPGIAYVSTSTTGGNHVVHVVTSPAKVSTWYAYMRSNTIKSGQLVKAGQQIGTVGHQGIATSCSLYFAVTSGPDATEVNPTRWLRTYVGKPVPTAWLAAIPTSFVLSSFNTLGAIHTVKNKHYPGYAVRVPKQVALLNSYKVDVAGLQEFEHPQRAAFLAAAGSTFGIYPSNAKADSDNSVIWRNSTMEFVGATTMPIPYFKGGIRQMPVVELRQRSTGLTAYFMNVHNPASLPKYGDQSKWRAQGVAIERAKVTDLLKTGRPVFFTGDFNDRQNAYCGVTAGGLMTAGNTSTPTTATTCTVPPHPWIDWIFTAGPSQFENYTIDTTPKDQHISDHPILISQVSITH
ncbi:MAG: Endonuclease/exonuclease/phosphatase [Marmoricola sp.]|nr:Endonuclease/exonuclease/phosphatase [Marmoricola sp.]